MIKEIRKQYGDDVYGLVVLAFAIFSLTRLDFVFGLPGRVSDGVTIGFLFGELAPFIYGLLIIHALTVFFGVNEKFKLKKTTWIGILITYIGLLAFASSVDITFVTNISSIDSTVSLDHFFAEWRVDLSRVSTGFFGFAVKAVLGSILTQPLIIIVGIVTMALGASVIVTGNALELYKALVRFFKKDEAVIKQEKIEIEKEEVYVAKEEIRVENDKVEEIKQDLHKIFEYEDEDQTEQETYAFLKTEHKKDKIFKTVSSTSNNNFDIIDSTFNDELPAVSEVSGEVITPQETYKIQEKEPEIKIEEVPVEPTELKQAVTQYDKVAYVAPIIKSKPEKDHALVQKNDAEEAKDIILNTLSQFGVNAEIDIYNIGPSVTKYELKLELGTKVSRVTQLQEDLKLALGTKEIRIEAPIPGKKAIGIEIPNKTRTNVDFSEVFKAMPEEVKKNKLSVVLGRDIQGNNEYCNLQTTPHLLIAGATGSGKSVCLNSILCSIIMNASPDEVKMVLIDPKKVELTPYQKLPHLLMPVITDAEKATVALDTMVQEMEDRYTMLQQANCRNIERYNSKADKKLPYILVVIDELADLMSVDSQRIEKSIQRLSQMARAAGIHLVVATQRPSTNVITGTIKANIPSRISFAVSSSIDSRTIIDQSGAEKLIGKGDMLYSPMELSSPVRIQGSYIDDDDVYDLCEQIVSHYS